MGAAQAVTQFLGGALNSVAMNKDYESQRAKMGYEIAVEENNAKLSDAAALASAERGNQQQEASREKYGQLRGDQTTGYAASGVAVSSGSALDTLDATSALSDYDAKVIQNNAAREAWGYRTKAAQQRGQVKLLRGAQNNLESELWMKQVGGMLGTAGNVMGAGAGSNGGGSDGGAGAGLGSSKSGLSSDNANGTSSDSVNDYSTGRKAIRRVR